MPENTKPLVFGYPLWNKVAFLFLAGSFVGAQIYSSIEFISYYFLKGNINNKEIISDVIFMIILLLVFDLLICKLFAKLIITQSELVYKPGGLIWRWFLRRRLPWQDYKFYLHYWIDIVPSSKHLYSYTTIYGVEKKTDKVRFKFKSRYPEFMRVIMEAVENHCSEYERVRDYTLLGLVG